MAPDRRTARLLEWIGREAGVGRPLALGGIPSAGTPATTLMPQRPAIVVGPGTTLSAVDRIAIYKAAVQDIEVNTVRPIITAVLGSGSDVGIIDGERWSVITKRGPCT